VAGTIDSHELRQFEKLIFRASRGKVLCYFDPHHFKVKDFDGIEKHRVVYVLVFQEGGYLKDKVKRICDAFLGKTFELPAEGHGGPEEFYRVMSELRENILKVLSLINESKHQMGEYLRDFQKLECATQVSLFCYYKQFVKQEKLVFTQLNKLSRERTITYGYLWSPMNKPRFLESFYGPDESLIGDQAENSPRQYRLNLEEIPYDKL
jgi:hypothetical protein